MRLDESILYCEKEGLPPLLALLRVVILSISGGAGAFERALYPTLFTVPGLFDLWPPELILNRMCPSVEAVVVVAAP